MQHMKKYSKLYAVLYKTDGVKRCYLCDQKTEYQIGRHEIDNDTDTLKYVIPMCSMCIRSFQIQYQIEPYASEKTPKMGDSSTQVSHGLENLDFDFT